MSTVKQSKDTLTWKNVEFFVNGTGSEPVKKQILQNVSGYVEEGQLCALMGPSGSGKTSLLNILANRIPQSSGEVLVNGKTLSPEDFRSCTAYVQQEDALLGCLTVRETVLYTAKLNFPNTSNSILEKETDEAIQAMGLWSARDTIVGTPLKKGLSGGQKRRLSVATQIVTHPRVLFLDEPTSGLDSTASFEVVNALKRLAADRKMLVIASIHQPSTSTLELFDSVFLLAKGLPIFHGAVKEIVPFFALTGHPCPDHMNPAEHMLDMTNTDFQLALHDAKPTVIGALNGESKVADDSSKQLEAAQQAPSLAKLHDIYVASAYAKDLETRMASVSPSDIQFTSSKCDTSFPVLCAIRSSLQRTMTSLSRAGVKAVRDPLAYLARLVMYIGLAILCATTFLDLPAGQEGIQAKFNLLFFGSAFLSFMCVAYVPAFIEDLDVFRRERASGVGSPVSFLLSNFIVGLPFLFLTAVAFTVIVFWAVPLRDGSFWTTLAYLYIDLLNAEAMVVLISSIMPNFVVALTLCAFANGLWMVVGGFLVTAAQLNDFWRHSFWYINYQRYVFFGLVENEISASTYDCAPLPASAGSTTEECFCMFDTSLASSCKVAGDEVVKSMGFEGDHVEFVWASIGILFGFKILSLAISYWTTRKN